MALNATTSEPSSQSDMMSYLLEHASYPSLRQLQCELCDGVATLRGQVPTYFLRQIALATVARAPDVHRVVDHIEVVDPDLPQLRRSRA